MSTKPKKQPPLKNGPMDRGLTLESVANRIITREKNISLKKVHVTIGISKLKKGHYFDLGNFDAKILVECKCHEWTKSGYSPSAKMSIWNEAMFYFSLAPKDYTNILFVKKSVHPKKQNVTLASYYLATYAHFIPENVEIWEYDEVLDKYTIYKNPQ